MSPSDPLDWASLRSRLRCVLRSPAYLATRAPDGATPICRAFGPGLLEAVVLDGADVVRYVTERDLGRWSASADEALDEGRWNLGRAPQVWLRRPDTPLFELVGEAGYEPSSLLVPGWLASQRRHHVGEPVVAVPCSTVLLMADGADPEAIASLGALTSELHAHAAIPLSTRLYGLGDDARVVERASVGPDEPDC